VAQGNDLGCAEPRIGAQYREQVLPDLSCRSGEENPHPPIPH
jgi:hypothetical protein